MPKIWVRSPLVARGQKHYAPKVHQIIEAMEGAGLTGVTAEAPVLPKAGTQERETVSIDRTTGIVSVQGEPVMCNTVVTGDDFSAIEADPDCEIMQAGEPDQERVARAALAERQRLSARMMRPRG